MTNKKIMITITAVMILLIIILLSRCSCGAKKAAAPVPAPVSTAAAAAATPAVEAAVEKGKTVKTAGSAKAAEKAMEGIRIKTKKTGGGGEALEILKNGKPVYSVEALPGEKIGVNTDGKDNNLPRAGEDVTGGGKPEMVVQVSSAKDSCSNSYEILSVIDDFKVLADIKGLADGVKFEDMDKDGKLEVAGHDCTFMDWWASFGEVPAPKVVLRYGDNGYVFAEDLMRKDPPGDAEMRAYAKKNKKGFITYVWKYMLDLIYTGNGDAAWKFFDMVEWDPSWEGQLTQNKESKDISDKEDFKQAFKEHLTTSVYWPQIKSFNNWEMLDVEM